MRSGSEAGPTTVTDVHLGIYLMNMAVPELKELASASNVIPICGDMRSKSTWVEAIYQHYDDSIQKRRHTSGGDHSNSDPTILGSDWDTEQTAPAHAPQEQQLPAGTCVVISGLVNQPDFNGKRGRIVTFDERRGRYNMELDCNKQKLSLKPESLHPAT